MTYADKWKIAQSIGKLLWALGVLAIMIVIWVHIIDGLIHKDYMQTIAWASMFMLVKLNEIKERI